ncbi:putative Zn-dependent protease [Sphingobium xanthum]|uniref:M48 family metalloprotease n=1 Tax=Sphingobium xanthum TaxID=1387165 RepID=UPI001FE47C7A|nr:M48 family metalloprotease [Sphingobium xanthum]
MLARICAVLAAAGLIAAQGAWAQSILRDAETEALMQDASAPLVRAAGFRERNVQIMVINDPSINAFVAGGQAVWFHSGLIAQADNLNQVQGVMAHELGHVEGGHVIRSMEGIKEATGIQLVTLLLGAAAMAAGGGEAGMGIMAMGQQAAMGKFLAFNRAQESSADAAGARYLHDAGISGKGSLEFFKKLQNLEYRLYVPQDTYFRTHPLSSDRVATLTHVYENDPAWNKPTDPALEARFQRVKAKLIGFVSEPQRTLQLYPETDLSVPARYARAYAYHKSAYTDKALGEVEALLKTAPHDPYFLELEGQVLLESGKPAQAIPPLREAVERTGGQPLIATLLGHALLATDDDAYLAEAERVLRNALSRDNDNPFGWYALGNVYQRKGDTARAALATAERYSMEGQAALALRHAEVAMSGISQGTPDFIRAQDIAMVSRAAMERTRKK